MKNIVRRVSAAIIIFAFFLPWIDLIIMELSGVRLIQASLGLGNDYNEPGLIIFGIAAIVMIVFAIWTVIQPKALPSILLFVPTVLFLIGVFSENESGAVILAGIYVLTIGDIGILISFFLKNEPITNQAPVYNAAPEAAATTQTTSSMSEQIFCTNCGTAVSNKTQFCGSCGVDLVH